MKSTFLSVIIPTHNRLSYLKELIEGLQMQKKVPLSYEIIVVCDGCIDGSIDWLQQVQANWPLLKVVKLQQGGPARARNTGAKLATGDWLVFTDDDCIPSVYWLSHIAKNIRQQPDIIGWEGATQTFPLFKHPLTHQIENTKGHPAVPTCNVAYNKATFWRAGGFDESFPFAHNEDADLAWRMKELGTIDFCADMLVYHPPRPVTFKQAARRMKILKSEFLLFHKNSTRYRNHRGRSPWSVIYFEVFFIHQARLLKSAFRHFKQPKLLVQGVALRLWWWLDLIRLFPSFIEANQYYKKRFLLKK